MSIAHTVANNNNGHAELNFLGLGEDGEASVINFETLIRCQCKDHTAIYSEEF